MRCVKRHGARDGNESQAFLLARVPVIAGRPAKPPAKHFWRKRTLATPPRRCFRPLRRRVRVVRSSCFGWPRLSRRRASPQIQPAHISRQKMCRGSGLKRACGRHRWRRGSWRESRPAEAKNRSGRSRMQQQQQEGRWPAGRRALAEVRSWQLLQLCARLSSRRRSSRAFLPRRHLSLHRRRLRGSWRSPLT